MNDAEIKGRAEQEQTRLMDLLIDSGVSGKRISVISPVVLNVAWMKAKLDDAREAIKNSQIVISYDNGGGQRGIRENPLFKGYESLWRAYISGMDRILSALPDEIAIKEKNEIEKPSNVLEFVRDKRRKKA